MSAKSYTTIKVFSGSSNHDSFSTVPMVARCTYFDTQNTINVDVGLFVSISGGTKNLVLVEYKSGTALGIIGKLNGSMLQLSFTNEMVSLHDEVDYKYAVFQYLDQLMANYHNAVSLRKKLNEIAKLATINED